mmetsp:Transcript_8409/g.12527  ORF Transcript_8409/g.12527 Transcript_8409/m.12527 type:complete len:218 (-) Transcript_8409:119-772(-)
MYSIINDNYCDLPDGSDEYQTSACSFLSVRYSCTSSHSIPTSRIDDGICDCCDGSDEWNRGSNCQNTCPEFIRNTDIVLVQNKKRKIAMETKNFIQSQKLIHSFENKEEIPYGSVYVPINAANLRGRSSSYDRQFNLHFTIFHISRPSALILTIFVLLLYIIYMLFQPYLIRRLAIGCLKCCGCFPSLYWYTHNIIFTLFHRLFTVQRSFSFKSHHV